jgi:DNA-binding transcriptional ArsR family regulator
MNRISPLPKVRLRDGFSDRNRIKEENKNIQYEDFDERTRITFCNTLHSTFYDISKKIEEAHNYENRTWAEQSVCKLVLKDVYVLQVDDSYIYDIDVLFKEYFYRTIKEDSYNVVLDLIEYFGKIDKLIDIYRISFEGYKKRFNDVFEYEFVGYRFVDDKIVAITDKNEIEAIEKAIIENPYEKCREHLSKALGFLSDRNNKDYSNSIKESISAVESICQIIVNDQATLGKALKQLEENGIIIDKALKEAFEKMYGYTSNAGNIRHANVFSTEKPAFEDAKYMLVACSAFVNYLVAKISKTKEKI